MDYSLINALSYNMRGIHRVCLFYDINCSYMRKLSEQVSNNEFINFPADLEIVPGIGIWHVHSHQPQCFSRYAPLFIPGIGWIDGEIIETLWSILNIISGSTCTMSTPHRQELLDFQMNDSNFMKMIRMGSVCSFPYQLCRSSLNDLRKTLGQKDEGCMECTELC